MTANPPANRPARPVLPKPERTASDGVFVCDKPLGVTSHDVVAWVRRLAGTRKVGHAGTLDPEASGVLVIGIGKATRLLQFFTAETKSYRARVCFGISTDTEDAAGQITAIKAVPADIQDRLEAEIPNWRGQIMQVPSAVSAIKIDGKRAYELAREGKPVDLPARPVEITRLDLVSAGFTTRHGQQVYEAVIEVDCSKGTYIRALGRDLGNAVRTGAHLTELRRISSGSFTVEQALTVEEAARRVEIEGELPVIPLAQACENALPVRHLTEAEARNLGYGKFIDPSGQPGPVAGIDPSGEVVAIIADRDGQARPSVVLKTSGG